MSNRSPVDTVDSRVLARRALGLANAAVGLAGVVRPARLTAALNAGAPPTPIVRVLGLRQFAQGVITTAAPRDDVVVAGAVVDLLHAVSMVPLLAWPRHRRAAAVSATLAVASAGGALATTRHRPATPSAASSRR